jgi:L-aminopeptidase/D-esterase-like protein
MMRPGFTGAAVHAVTLSGGSLFGLASVDGVVRWCEEHGIGAQFANRCIPIVSGAIIFDLNIGNGDVRPDSAAGYKAAAAAKAGRVAEGSVGAGTGATVAGLLGQDRRLKGGLGTASEEIGGGIVIGALAVVNAVGEVVDSRNGRVVAGPRGEPGEFLDTLKGLRRGARSAPEPGQATTIGVVATNAKLTKEQTNRLAAIAHDGLARAIRPAHTMVDGDTIFALATGERELGTGRMLQLEAFTPGVFERAILKAVLAATSLAGVPSASEWRAGSKT